jgi:hypothetical protein
MVTCQTGQPRVMPGTDGTSVNGQLDEAARTNTVIQSQSFDNAAWTKLGVAGAAAPIVTADQATAPDGTLTAERIQFAATSGAQESDLSQVISNASASSATVYFKGNGTTGILDLCLWNGATYTCTACTFVAAGWTRCEVDNVNGGGASATILFGNATVRNGGTARAANDVFAWGADWEVGDYASSYIATTSAGVARVADLADVAITLPTLTQLCVGDTIITPSSITASQAVLTGTLGDGTLGGAAGSTNYFTSQYSGGTALAVTAGAGTPTSATFGSALTGAHRYTVFHTGTLLSGCVDGVCAAGTAGSFSNPTFTRFRLGMFAVTSNNMGGITKLVTIDPVFSRCR